MEDHQPTIEILLIEDDPDDQMVIRQALSANEDSPYHLHQFENLRDGIAYIVSHKVDLILLDLTLPDSYRSSTIEKMSAWVGEIPVVVLTGSKDRDLAKLAIQKGAEDYLVKGHIDEYSLDTSIRNALERHRYMGALISSSLQLHQVIDNNLDGMVVLDLEGGVIFANSTAELLCGNPSHPLVGSKFLFTFNRNGSAEIETTDRQGKQIMLEMRAARVHWDGSVATLVCLRDITERYEIEKKLRTYSFIDDLTQLYNRRAFYTVANDQLKLARRENKSVTLFFMDFDRLKFINDNFGHGAGDQALITTSTILKKVFRGSDVVARMGGDEFAILAINAGIENMPNLLARLEGSFQEANQSGVHPYTLAISIGTVIIDPSSSLTLDELLAEADTRQYIEKMRKRGM